MEGQRFSYFTLSRAVRLHEMLIKVSGGLPGHCPERLMMLESTLELIQNDCYYPSFFDKVAHLLYSTNKNHAFLDGNKRASLLFTAYFLLINGYEMNEVKNFMRRMEGIVVQVACNKVGKDSLKSIIKDIMRGQP